MGKKVNQEEWLKKARNVHMDSYGYGMAIYVGSKIPLQIYCNIHKKYFKQTPNNHLQGKGCFDCGVEKRADAHKSSTEKWKVKAKMVHGTLYDYSESIYIGSDAPVDIICKIHGKFTQATASNHLQGNGCYDCYREKKSEAKKYNTDEWILKAIAVHGSTYVYSESTYIGSDKPIDIICKVHGKFTQGVARNHLQGQGCIDCGRESISGENHHWYKDGKWKERNTERNSTENQQWTKSIKENKTQCDCCHEPFSEYLTPHAHHLNSWVDNPDERFDINNGVAICEECHWEFHEKYGYGYNTKEQYYQFRQIKQIEEIK